MDGRIELLQVLNRRIAILKDELARLYDKTEKKRIGSKQRIKLLTESHMQLNEQRRGLELQADNKLKEVLELEKEVRCIFHPFSLACRYTYLSPSVP